MRIDDHLPLTPLSHAVLLALADGPLHGYAIMRGVEEHDEGVRAGTGTLYAALQRMEEDGLIRRAAAPPDETDARRRYYALTELGRSVARAEAGRLARLLERAAAKRLGPEAAR